MHMTFGKAAGLTAGFIGAFGLGVAVGPSITQRDTHAAVTSTPPVVAEVPQVPQEKPKAGSAARTPSRARAEASAAKSRSSVVAVAPATHPQLQQRLKRVLNRGANLNVAAAGFKSGEEFAAVAHASRNTKVPFMVLKHYVVEERMPLDKALRSSKPDIDAAAEAKKARSAARSDVASLAL
jgi:hypothetical protein